MSAGPPARKRTWLLLAAVAPGLLLLGSCGPSRQTTPNTPDEPQGPPFFQDVTAGSGIDHTYRNGTDVMVGVDDDGRPIGNLTILELPGGGAGLIDFDRDGRLDVFLPGGGTYTGDDHRTIVGLPCKMYRNLGHFQFQDVTREVGLDKIDFFTFGVAVADYNNDGWPDLLVTGWGRLALFRNDPVDPNDPSKGRKFTDVTKEAGLTDDRWSTGAGWADFDGDGHVDLYVCHYVAWHFGKDAEDEKKSNPKCNPEGGRVRDLCALSVFAALPHVLYRNNGDGTFTDVSKSAGLRVPRTDDDYKSLNDDYFREALGRLKGQLPEAEVSFAAARQAADRACKRLREADAAKDYGKGLGVVIVDIDGDGKPDVYVACDTVDSLLYVNRSRPGQILFEEMGLDAGVARDDNGSPLGSMGTDASDCAGTLRPALWCVNYENERHSLYYNEGTGGRVRFRYATLQAGIAAIGQSYVGWGTRFVDFDLDGFEDLFISNGHVYSRDDPEAHNARDVDKLYRTGAPDGSAPALKARQAQRPVLMQCAESPGGGRRYRDITAARGGDYCRKAHIGRGVAFGDLDNDGRVDLVLAHLNEPAAVLKTVAGDGNHWVGFELERKGHRDPVGARVILEAGGKKQARFAKGGGSYASANDPRHVFGLGKGEKIDRVTVTWPDLTEQTWEGLAVDRYWHLVEGQKDARPAAPAP